VRFPLYWWIRLHFFAVAWHTTVRTITDMLVLGYVQIGKLGKGSSASVFKAVDIYSLRLVAVKVINFGSDTKAHRQIKHEVTALRSQRAPLLSAGFGADSGTTPCPNISRFYGCVVNKSQKQASIAMEYESCGSLEDWTKEGMPTPEPWLAHVAHSVLKVCVRVRCCCALLLLQCITVAVACGPVLGHFFFGSALWMYARSFVRTSGYWL
jgi:serine/threonine protein kinase